MKNMGELLNRADFARLAGVNPANVTRAVARGRIKIDGDGKIDPEEETACKFLMYHRRAVRSSSGKGRPIEGGAAVEPGAKAIVRRISDMEDEELAGLDAGGKGKILSNRLVKEKLKEKRLSNLKVVGASVPKVLVRRGFSSLVSVLEQQFRNFDQVMATKIDAMVKVGKGKPEIAELLRKEIDVAMKAFAHAAKHAIRNMRPDEEPV
jgi:hypothetical protein